MSRSEAKSQIKLPTKEFRCFIMTHKNIIKDVKGSGTPSPVLVDYHEIENLSNYGKNYNFLFSVSV